MLIDYSKDKEKTESNTVDTNEEIPTANVVK
jgi:hypothetical protein